MSEPARGKLYAVDEQTGEFIPSEAACPHCQGKQFALDELTRKYHGVLSQLGQLRADRDAEAVASKYWGQAVALFMEWKIAAEHPNSGWTAERFWLCQPYLEQDGFVMCRWAVWGIAYQPNTKVFPNGYVERYDSWELCFKNRGTYERYVNRGRASPEARRQFAIAEENDAVQGS